MILYLCLRYLFHCHYRCPQQMYRLLKISLLFYLLPIPLLSNWIRNTLGTIVKILSLPDIHTRISDTIRIDSPKFYETTPEGFIHLYTPGTIFLIGFGLWLFIAVILLLRKVIQYYHVRKIILANASAPSSATAKKMEQICRQISLSRTINVLVIEGEFPLITMGFLNPIIVIPKDIDMEIAAPVLLHECIHIRKLDALVKILSMLALVLHWYLPFVYLLIHEINDMAELDCDDRVSHYLSESELKDYGNLIIEMSSESFTQYINNNLFLASFHSKSCHLTKERLKMLKYKNRKKLIPLTCSLLLAVCFGTVSAAGYQTPTSHVVEAFSDTDHIEFYTESSTSESYLTDDSETESFLLDVQCFQQADSYFISEDGDVVIPESENTTRLFCSHTYIDGYERTHLANSSGGCTVKTYHAKRCTKCGQIVRGDLISTYIYVTCPHE